MSFIYLKRGTLEKLYHAGIQLGIFSFDESQLIMNVCDKSLALDQESKKLREEFIDIIEKILNFLKNHSNKEDYLTSPLVRELFSKQEWLTSLK